MTTVRSLFTVIPALTFLSGACSSDVATPSGSGGSQATGGSTTGGSLSTGGSTAGGSTSTGGSSGQTQTGGSTSGGFSGAAGQTGGSTSGGLGGAGGQTGGSTSGGFAGAFGSSSGNGGSIGGNVSMGGAGAGGRGGAAGAGGSGGASAGAGGLMPGNAPVPSAGCGKALGTLKSGSHTITSSNTQREYTIDIPTAYDPNKPYRLIFAWHWINASDDAVVNGQVSNGGAIWAYYGLKNQANTSGQPAIFIAPQSRDGRWDQQDHVLFDDLWTLAKNELCIDTTRVFATGFSFGAMITYSLSTNHQRQLRAVSGLAPANYNIYLPTNTHEPIAYMSTTGMGDTTCPWDAGNNRGARYAASGHAQDNGCTVPATIPTTTAGSRSHLCFDFTGCRTGYPVKACTFDGGHIAAHADGGTGDNGTTTWMPEVTWEFFTQF
jgi:poly(3-hydroxybutyrate) depolymerase